MKPNFSNKICKDRRVKRKETDQKKGEPLKSFNEFILGIEDSEIDKLYKAVSIYGDCIWDIFSNNHTVYNKYLESYDLGSFRGSGSFIDDGIDKIKLIPERHFNYGFLYGFFRGRTKG